MGKSCCHETEDTFVLVFCLIPHVWQKQVFAGRNSTLVAMWRNNNYKYIYAATVWQGFTV